jgi:hypothetical protein
VTTIILPFALALVSAVAPQADSAAFVKRFVAAVNSGSVAQRRALQHPRDTCSAKQFVDDIVTRQAARPIDANYEWRISKLSPGPLPFEGMIRYTVRPTHQLQLHYKPTPYGSVTMLVTLVRSPAGWHEVHGCPTPEALARMAVVQREIELRKQELRRRINAMPPAVRDSILALHLAGRAVSATSYYATAMSLDKTLANEVVDSVIARHRVMYKYAYPHNTRTLIEDHYIVIDTIGGTARGWYYGTTDDFDDAREGYQPGFYVAPMRDLRFGRGTIAFSVKLDPEQIFTDPLPYTVRDPRTYGPTARRWRVTRLTGSRAYAGTVTGDSIGLQVGREKRGFRRLTR